MCKCSTRTMLTNVDDSVNPNSAGFFLFIYVLVSITFYRLTGSIGAAESGNSTEIKIETLSSITSQRDKL